VQDRTPALRTGNTGVGVRQLIPFAPSLNIGKYRRWAVGRDAERVGGFGSRSFRVSEESAVRSEGSISFLSAYNDVCLGWLTDTLRQLRQEGRTKAVGYLEAVLEEVVFEMKMSSKSEPTARKASRSCQ
jgi:hypothetical protein